MRLLSESKIIKKFQNKVNEGDFTGIKITCKITGGIPNERLEEEHIISGTGKVYLKMRNSLTAKYIPKISIKTKKEKVQKIIKEIAEGIHSLVPESETNFLPDSLVGSITLEMEGKKTKLYFLAEEEDRISQHRPISLTMNKAIQDIIKISRVSKKEIKNG